VGLLVLLVVSAGAGLLLQPRVILAVRAEQLSPEWLLVAPGVFTLFILLTAVDTFVRARRRGFVSGRALAQLAFAVVFIGFLFPQAWTEYRARKAPAPDSIQMLHSLTQHRDPRVRAVVMDLAGFRGDASDVAQVLAAGLEDRDPMVRQAALASIGRRAAIPLGEGDIPEAEKLLKSWMPGQAQKNSAP
jgi:hypothetical protein